MESQVVSLGIVLLLLTASIGSAAAQSSEPDSTLLDTESRQLGTLEGSGDSYTVYKVENILPYASGVEIYSDGATVTDESVVNSVTSRVAARRTLSDIDTSVSPAAITSQEAARNEFRVAAWEISTNQLTQSDVDRLRSVSTTAADIDTVVSPPLSAINAQLDLFNRMEQTGLLGVTVWDTATKAHPSLEQYRRGLEELQTQLNELNTAAEGVVQDIDPAIDSINRAQQGEEVDYEALSEQLTTASESLTTLQSKAETVGTSLSDASQGASEAAQALQSSQVPNQFVSPLSTLSNQLGDASSNLQAFSSRLEKSSNQLSTVQEKASSTQQEFMNNWQSERSALKSQYEARQTAQQRVLGTLGGGSIALLGGLVLLRRIV
jgi:DNA repair exonuclease SbcCD ATPase subunit